MCVYNSQETKGKLYWALLDIKYKNLTSSTTEHVFCVETSFHSFKVHNNPNGHRKFYFS